MTPLTKPVTRTVTTRLGDKLVVTMAPDGLIVRELGRRTALATIPYGHLFMQAARISAEQLMSDRRTRRAK